MRYVSVPFPVTDEMLAEHRKQAALSERRRYLYLICGGTDQPTQAFLNTFLQDSYVRPHRHVMDEYIEVIDGTFRLNTFNETGTIIKAEILHTGDTFVLHANVWHTSACITEYGTFLGIKEGYYSPETDKEFAPVHSLRTFCGILAVYAEITTTATIGGSSFGGKLHTMRAVVFLTLPIYLILAVGVTFLTVPFFLLGYVNAEG